MFVWSRSVGRWLNDSVRV